MRSRHGRDWTRRELLGGAILAGAAGVLGGRPEPASAEPPPETTTIRMIHDPEIPTICYAPQYVAEELLRGEGFTDVRYVPMIGGSEAKTLVAGQADLSGAFAADLVVAIDRGDPILVMAGLHVGCTELFGTERVRTIRDLKGKTMAVSELGVGEHLLLSSMLAYIGIDPRRDVKWVVHLPADSVRLFTEGKVDAYMAFPPEPQELRAKKIGHVILNTATDRPWSQYFCCMLSGNRDFVRRNPVATKRALRAILKANQICALEPERAARLLVEKRYAVRYDYALQALREIPYAKWREWDPESPLRFHALRLREVAMIKKTPQQILAQGTDWRFLTELKKELKG